jgi:hypothetical protein
MYFRVKIYQNRQFPCPPALKRGDAAGVSALAEQGIGLVVSKF